MPGEFDLFNHVNIPGLIGKCSPNPFDAVPRMPVWHHCIVCEEELPVEDSLAHKPICKGCITAIKTFRSAIGS